MSIEGEALVVVEAVIRDKNGNIKEAFQAEVNDNGHNN